MTSGSPAMPRPLPDHYELAFTAAYNHGWATRAGTSDGSVRDYLGAPLACAGFVAGRNGVDKHRAFAILQEWAIQAGYSR